MVRNGPRSVNLAPQKRRISEQATQFPKTAGTVSEVYPTELVTLIDVSIRLALATQNYNTTEVTLQTALL